MSDPTLPMDTLRRLLSALAAPRCVCILGAGASAPQVPMGPALSRLILIARYETMQGGFPVERPVQGPIVSRLMPSERPNDLASVRGVKTRSLDDEVKNEFLLLNKMSDLQKPLPQFDIFRLLPPSLTVVTYNTDGLAQRYIRQRVIPMHGAHYPYRVGDKWLAAGIFPPSPERDRFLLSSHIKALTRELEVADALVIISYTFGQFCGSLDDAVSYCQSINILRGRNMPIVVVDPFNTDLVFRLREDLKTNAIYYLGAFWNLLALAMLMVGITGLDSGIQNCMKHIEDVRIAYAVLLSEAESRTIPSGISAKRENLILGDNAGIVSGPHSTFKSEQQAIGRLSTRGAAANIPWPRSLYVREQF